MTTARAARAAAKVLRDSRSSKASKDAARSALGLDRPQRSPGRREPYTERGIARVPCARCGRPSQQQWQVCADGNRYRGLCLRCDVALNRMVLRFIRDPDQDDKIREYEARLTPSEHPMNEASE